MYDLVGNRTLPQLLDEQAELYPEQTFLVFEGRDGSIREYTYRELHDGVARVARGFAELGIGRGDKVAVHLRNCPEFVFTFLSLARLGAIMVPGNVANRAPEAIHVLGHSDCRLLVTALEYVDLFAEVLPSTPLVGGAVVVGSQRGETLGVPVHSFDELLGSELYREQVPIGSEDPVQIVFTSGTTARPKGVVLTHANCLWSIERETRNYHFEPGDRLLTTLPLFHVNAQAFGLLPALGAGATLILIEEYSASKFWGQVRRHRATHTSLVAMLLRTLMLQPAEGGDRDHCLRTVNYAINVPPAEKDAFEQRFGVELINGYGLSEAMIGVCAAPLHGDRRWPSIGPPAIDRLVKVVDDEGNEVPAGVVGEIVVWGVPGRTITAGYYKDPQATDRAIVDGWLHTGDNGYADEHGFLYFFDRKKDVIKRAGENVSASEVEVALLEHPAVRLAAVIGVPDPIRDEAVKALVVLADSDAVSEEEIIEHCRRRLAPFKVPTIVEFRDSLPLTSVGKVEKKVLRAEVTTGP